MKTQYTIEMMAKCRNSHIDFMTKEVICSAACGAMTFPAMLGLLQHCLWKPSGVAAHVAFAKTYGFFTVTSAAAASCLVSTTLYDHLHGISPETDAKSLAAFTTISVVHFMLFGNFKSVLPSHVLHPGAFARKYLYIGNYDLDVTNSQRKKIQVIGNKYGCHTCGKIYSPVFYLRRRVLARIFPQHVKQRKLYFADHSPPLAVAKASWRKISSGVLYPQCQHCSNLQASCVRSALNSKSQTLIEKGFVTHASRFKLWKIWFPWPVLTSYDQLVNLSEVCFSSLCNFIW